jgi:hypothetical protein
MNSSSEIVDIAKRYAKKTHHFIGYEIVNIPVLPKHFERFNTKELSQNSKSKILELITTIEAFLKHDTQGNSISDSGYEMYQLDEDAWRLDADSLNGLLKMLKEGLKSNLFIESTDSEFFEKIPFMKDTIDSQTHYKNLRLHLKNLRQVYFDSLPEALKIYREKIGDVILNRRPDITNLLTSTVKRQEIFTETVIDLLSDCFSFEQTELDKCFLLQVLIEEGYSESLQALTIESAADLEYKEKLGALWAHLEKNQVGRFFDGEDPIYLTEGMTDLIYSTQNTLWRREIAIKNTDIESIRAQNSGPFFVQGYLIIGLTITFIYLFSFFGILLGAGVWFYFKKTISDKRNENTCENCSEVFTVYAFPPHLIGTRDETIIVPKENKIRNADGAVIATVEGTTQAVVTRKTHEITTCCVSCGIVDKFETTY